MMDSNSIPMMGSDYLKSEYLDLEDFTMTESFKPLYFDLNSTQMVCLHMECLRIHFEDFKHRVWVMIKLSTGRLNDSP